MILFLRDGTGTILVSEPAEPFAGFYGLMMQQLTGLYVLYSETKTEPYEINE